jgi:hypothetical protein
MYAAECDCKRKSDPTVYSNDGCNINAHTIP